MTTAFQFNYVFSASKFPASVKFANKNPVFKNGSRSQKDNYRPISILPSVAKIFKKMIRRQLSNQFDNLLLRSQYRCRKSFGTQHCLFLMTEKWRKSSGWQKRSRSYPPWLVQGIRLHLQQSSRCKIICLCTVFSSLKTNAGLSL